MAKAESENQNLNLMTRLKHKADNPGKNRRKINLNKLSTGWPRQFQDAENVDLANPNFSIEKRIPIIWSESSRNLKGDYAQGTDDDAMWVIWSSEFSVCDVCGEELGKQVVYATSDNGRYSINGLGMHPRCALLANKFCPYFQQDEKAARKDCFLFSEAGLALDFKQTLLKIGWSKEEIIEMLETDVQSKKWTRRHETIADDVFSASNFPLRKEKLKPVSVDQLKELVKDKI